MSVPTMAPAETFGPVAAPAATGTIEYLVPVDPMDELQCESCQ